MFDSDYHPPVVNHKQKGIVYLSRFATIASSTPP